MNDELPWLPITEAADRSGMNRETLRSRARRGLVPTKRSNAGQILVQVPTGTATASDQGTNEALTELQEEIADLRTRLTRAETELALVKDVAAAEVEAARRIAAAEVAAKVELVEDLRRQVEWHRRPWWRRWIG